MINPRLLLEGFRIWRPFDATVLPGQELHMRRFFEQDGGDAGFFNRGANHDNAVVLQQESPGHSQGGSHSLTQGWSHDEIARLREAWEHRSEQCPFMIDRA